ncbi:sialomucin core protein 24 [Eublepharis macularius]|uniref:Sialomucin core protein 24 n=1 Tax=Eublepharis macularius TaxID=481883 RepID=A0AA97JDS7_EUBMA|nr:sialomucin core protein 24 [Eublepharis macularius]
MGSRRLSTPLGRALLLLVGLAFCLAYLSGVAAEREEAGCGSHSCSSCLNSTNSNSSCYWLECKEVNQSRCTNRTEEHANCTVYNHLEQCSTTPASTTASAPASTTTSTSAQGNTTHTVSPKVPTTSANTTVTTTTIPGTQPPRKSTFDASSFIGGIVLVLGLQAVIFFLYKFCKSKDQNYHTL